jgi:predicted transcriptional regulator
MVAPNYAETRSSLAKKMGLGRSRTVVAKKPARKVPAKRGGRG